MITLMISNNEMENIIEVLKFFTKSGLLIKGVSERIENKEKWQNFRFTGISLGT